VVVPVLRADPEGMKLLPKRFVQDKDVLVIGQEGDVIVVAVVDIRDFDLIEELSFITGRRVRAVQAPRALIREEVGRFYAPPVAPPVGPPEAKPEPTLPAPRFVFQAIAILLAEKGLLSGEELAECTRRYKRSSSPS